MGCDIHMYAEQRDENGDWQPLQEWHDENFDDEDTEYEYWCAEPSLPDHRNYSFFGFLADVRRDSGFNQERLGMPSDASMEVKRAGVEDGDWHSHSFITYEDLKAAVIQFGSDKEAKLKRVLLHQPNEPVMLDNLCGSSQELVTAMEKLPKFIAGRDQRFVFWFDN